MAHLLLRLDTNASARLRGLKPFVLQPEGAVTLELPTGTFSGPIERCEGMCRDPVRGEVESGGEFFGEVAGGGPSSTVSGFATGA